MEKLAPKAAKGAEPKHEELQDIDSTAVLEADAANTAPATVILYLRHYGPKDILKRVYGPQVILQPGQRTSELSWRIPETGGFPIAEIGLEIDSPQGRPGNLYLDYLTWAGAPDTTFARPAELGNAWDNPGKAWHISWISSASDFVDIREGFRIMQNQDTGLLMQGGDWQDYRVETVITPHMVAAAGLAARVQGLSRFYALKVAQGGKIHLVKTWYDQEIILGEADFKWEFGQEVALALEVEGQCIRAYAEGTLLFTVVDEGNPLISGGIALLVTEGRASTEAVRVRPL